MQHLIYWFSITTLVPLPQCNKPDPNIPSQCAKPDPNIPCTFTWCGCSLRPAQKRVNVITLWTKISRWIIEKLERVRHEIQNDHRTYKIARWYVMNWQWTVEHSIRPFITMMTTAPHHLLRSQDTINTRWWVLIPIRTAYQNIMLHFHQMNVIYKFYKILGSKPNGEIINEWAWKLEQKLDQSEAPFIDDSWRDENVWSAGTIKIYL